MNKTKEKKAYIYPQIYERLTKGEDYALHGLSFAVNAELSRHYGIDLPSTPTERMADGARKQLRSKKQHSIVLPENWLKLLESLVKEGEPWFRKDYPQLSNISGKCGLVSFLPNRGARSTQKLKTIWAKPEKVRLLRDLYIETARAMGYGIKFSGNEDD